MKPFDLITIDDVGPEDINRIGEINDVLKELYNNLLSSELTNKDNVYLLTREATIQLNSVAADLRDGFDSITRDALFTIFEQMFHSLDMQVLSVEDALDYREW